MRILLFIWVLFYGASASAHQFELTGETRQDWEKGWSVDIEGDIAVVGLPGTVVAGRTTGVADVYRFNNSQWEFEQRLTDESLGPRDEFGNKVVVFQERIIVSAFNADREVDGETFDRSGQVFVYEKQDGLWVKTADLIPSEVEALDVFGFTMAAGVNQLFIGKGDFDSPAGTASGGVFVFEYINDRWVETDFINPGILDGATSTFGLWDIAVDADKLAITNAAVEDGSSFGVIYLYQLIEGRWEFDQSIESPSSSMNSFFGNRISLKGNRLLVSSPTENDLAGAAYLYEKTDGMWQQVRRFASMDTTLQADFGIEVELGDDQLFIGSRHANRIEDDRLGEGEVYVYNFINDSWVLSQTLEADGDQGHNDFGQSMALDHDQLIVGAPYHDLEAGAAYVFDVNPNAEKLTLNAGLNGAWYNPQTAGQGVFLDVSSDSDFSFMGLFTYDTATNDTPAYGQIGSQDHRWLVGEGRTDQFNQAIVYDLYYTSDGLFDDPRDVVVEGLGTYGQMTIQFQSCASAVATYHLYGTDISGSYSLIRPVPASGELCADFAAASSAFSVGDGGYDYRNNGGWFNPETSGQGFFIDQFNASETAFMGWFTYDTMLVDNPIDGDIGVEGQRWLVGDGRLDETNPNVLNYELYYTSGGIYDEPTSVNIIEPGTYGTLQIEFTGCNSAVATYDITDEGLGGTFDLVRAVPRVSSCENNP